MKRIKSDKIVTPDGLFDGYLYFENGMITECSAYEHPADECFDMTGLYVSPGFIDIHTHGGDGHEFVGTAEDIVCAANFHYAHGTTTIFPTFSAADLWDVFAPALDNCRKAMASPALLPHIGGVHLEGPYLSTRQVGGQCADFITPPKKEAYLPFLDKYADIIARFTYAPENDPDLAFLQALKQHEIVPSVGHSDATYEELLPAYENGLHLVTHLYSCTSSITRIGGFRHLGIIETAYLLDGMFTEIIADGKHLPPELIRLIVKLKGRDKVCLVTDSLAMAGSEDGEGTTLGGVEYVIEDGVCKLRDRSAFAGSIATADRLIRTLVKEVGISVTDAVYMMTCVPACVMGLSSVGRLEAGYAADIVVFDEDIRIVSVF